MHVWIHQFVGNLKNALSLHACPNIKYTDMPAFLKQGGFFSYSNKRTLYSTFGMLKEKETEKNQDMRIHSQGFIDAMSNRISAPTFFRACNMYKINAHRLEKGIPYTDKTLNTAGEKKFRKNGNDVKECDTREIYLILA